MRPEAEENKSRMVRTFGVNGNLLRARSGSMPSSHAVQRPSSRCRAWEHGPSLVNEPYAGLGVTAGRKGLNAKIRCMSTGLDGPLYVP